MGQKNNLELQVYTGDSFQFIKGLLSRHASTQQPEKSSSLLKRFWENLNSPNAPLFILAMLAQVVAVSADTIYPQDPTSLEQLRVDFDGGDFPRTRSLLQKYCDMVIYETPQIPKYIGATRPVCLQGNVKGPSIAVWTQDGQLPTTIANCIKHVMQDMCSDYYNRHSDSGSGSSMDGKTALIILLCIAGLIAVGCCCLFAARRCRDASDDDYIAPPAYRPGPYQPDPLAAPTIVINRPPYMPPARVVRPAPVIVPSAPVIIEPVIIPQPSIFDYGSSWRRDPTPPRPQPHHDTSSDVSVGFDSFYDNSSATDNSSNNVSVGFDAF
ncbi:MAG: hypothetical protein SFW66_00330 [Gammaproteobacteria bacterium]|nr:hypothetical protein [Gammaproteobacteria bacterium]